MHGGDVDTAWLGAEEETVRSRLREELERLSGADPFSALGLERSAESSAIRQAFLARTKLFHPHRFARRGEEIRDAATEVFLLIKKAYGRISTEAGRQRVLERLGPQAGQKRRFADTVQTAIPAPTTGELGGERSRAGKGTEERAALKTRVSFQQGRPKANPKPAPGAGRPARRSSEARRARLRRELTPAPVQRSRDLVEQAHRENEAQSETFDRGLELIREKRPGEARELFKQLAVGNPSEKKYRVYMHYAWGWELQAAEQHDQARAEYSRALSLDASFEPAKRALESLGDAKKGKGGGFFARLFRK